MAKRARRTRETTETPAGSPALSSNPPERIVFLDFGDVFCNGGERLRNCLVEPAKNKSVPGIINYRYQSEYLHGTPMYSWQAHDRKRAKVRLYTITNNDEESLRDAIASRFGKDVARYLSPVPDEWNSTLLGPRDLPHTRVLCLNFPVADVPDPKKIAKALVSATLDARRLAESAQDPDSDRPDQDSNPDRCGVKLFLDTMGGDRSANVPKAANAKKINAELLRPELQADYLGDTAETLRTAAGFLQKLNDEIIVRPISQILHVLHLTQPGHSEDHRVLQTSVKPRFLRDFCHVKRMMRGPDGTVLYQQRAKIKKHIDRIAEQYRDRHKRFMASNIVLAYDSDDYRVKNNTGSLVVPHPDPTTQVIGWPEHDYTAHKYGFLLVQRERYDDFPLFVIDGQQRMMALEKSGYPDDFDVPVFIYGVGHAELTNRLQDDLIKINTTHPFSKTDLDAIRAARTDLSRTAAEENLRVVHLLNCETDFGGTANPFAGRIKLLSFVDKDAKMSARIAAEMVGHLKATKVADDPDFAKRAKRIAELFGVVKAVFPEDWSAQPSRSYLTGGVGLTAMGRLLGKLQADVRLYGLDTSDRLGRFKTILEGIKSKCAWMRQVSDEDGGHPWHRLQNNSADYDRLETTLVGGVDTFIAAEGVPSPRSSP